MIFWLSLLFGTFFEVIGDIFFKKNFLWWGMFFYTTGTFFWAYSLRFGDLSKSIVIFSILNLVLAVFAGVYFFHENLSWVQWLGVGFGFVSIILLSL